MPPSDFQLIVVGAGPAGLAAGLAATKLGLKTAVVGPMASQQDGRTAALLEGSVRLLRAVDVWDRLAPDIEQLSGMRLVDAMGGLFRAPEVLFRADEIGREAFGYNVPNAALTAAMEARASTVLTRIITSEVTAVELTEAAAIVTTADGHVLSAPFIAAADGRNSVCRAAAGIALNTWQYDQSALVTSFTHTRAHDRISTEFHRPGGPLTVVPGPGKTSSLVWVDRPSESQRRQAMTDEAFITELETHLAGLLGTLSDIAPRVVFPLSGQTAHPLAAKRVALIGEAGHILPPIGAQGLNLSFRDAATLADIAAGAIKENRDPGCPSVLAAYDSARRSDVTQRVWGVDLLNRSLLMQAFPIQMMRGIGLLAVATIPPLRQRVMREGMLPEAGLPSLMRG